MRNRLFVYAQLFSITFLVPCVLSGMLSCTGEKLASSAVCGNGVIQGVEECDNATSNSPTAECTTNCILNYCGDGLIFDGTEICDNGMLNSDLNPDACRESCLLAHCGDNVIDTGEECDRGPANSNTNADACRLTCVTFNCGDGVRDSGEECDTGPENSDLVPDACRENCTAARCGDGVKDGEEDCDDGEANSDDEADSCREDCGAARCGDDILDSGEECDNGSLNSDLIVGACSTACTLPKCAPTEVSSSSHAAAGSIVGSQGISVMVACESGYSGGGEWVCGFDAVFTGTVCTAIPCTATETPHSVAHSIDGSITGATGDTVGVVCNSGYEGGGEWTCSANGLNPGLFSGSNCSPLSCAANEVSNSTDYEKSGSLTGVTGDVVTVQCKPGYSGGGDWTCSPAGTTGSIFSGAPCTPISCASTQTPYSVSYSSDGSIMGSTGSTVEVVCNSGYEGGGEWICQPTSESDAFFTGTICSPSICIAGKVSNSIDYSERASLTGVTGDAVYVNCKQGYIGGGLWTCNNNAFFAGPKCLPLACPHTQTPNSVSYSEHRSIRGTTGTTVIVQCEDGFFGGGSWHCNPNSTFTGPGCTENGCVPVEVPYSDHENTDSVYGSVGDTVNVTCEGGYAGGGAWSCAEDRTFSGAGCVYATCQSAQTPDSDHSESGTITGISGDSVRVKCDQGFTGGGMWTCYPDLTFRGPICGEDTCIPTRLANSDHAPVDSINGVYFEEVDVICEHGYSGGGTWLCNSDGTFIEGDPCVADACDTSVAPENGVAGDCPASIKSGDTCQPGCNEGYYVKGISACMAGDLKPAECIACDEGTECD